MISRLCPVCQKPFEYSRIMQRYCTVACALWGRVDKPETGCWEWTGYRKKGAYGALTFNGVRHDVHRLAFTLSGGNAEGLFVCHKCDNPICCKPDHLFAGTPLDNTRDMDTKGRRKVVTNTPKGSAHYASKLNDQSVAEIRARYTKGGKLGALATEFGVSKSLVHLIVTRKRWTHI